MSVRTSNGHQITMTNGAPNCARCGAVGADELLASWCSERLIGRRVLMPEAWAQRHRQPREGVVGQDCGPEMCYVLIPGLTPAPCAKLSSLTVLPKDAR